jgi:cytochrome c oxidase subunit 2
MNSIRSIFELWYQTIFNSVVRKITHGSIREYLWTLFPAIVLIIIAIPSIRVLYTIHEQAFASEFIYTFKVIGHQWFWSYEFFSLSSDSVDFDSYMLSEESVYILNGFRLLEVDNPILVPILIPVRFIITSIDVIHSWAIPSLGIKVDAVPGRLNEVCLIINRAGEFYGQCSEICGVNHGFMPIKLIAVKC